MKIAFDAQCFSRSKDSMDRVLRVLIHAAEHVGIDYELWSDDELREDASVYQSRTVATPKRRPAEVDAFWSPELSAPSIEIPSIATLHDINPLLPDGRSILARWRRIHRYRRSVRETLRQVNRLVTDTEDAKVRVAEAFPQTSDILSTVPLFVDPSIAPLKGPQGQALLDNLSLSPGYILFVGSMRRHKNWDGLMRAYAALPPSLQAAHPLVFAGRCHRAKADAEKLATSLNIRQQVSMTGVVDEDTLHALYGGASLLVCPSFMEGFGFPPLEAMACGVPVVATNRTCVPEVLGNAAFYIDPDSIPSITDGIEQMLVDSTIREQRIADGLQQAASFTPARTGQAMLEVLSQTATT